MNVQDLLKGKTDCPCGREHSCDIRHVIIKSGAVKELPSICTAYSHIVLVADKNTYATCGDTVVFLLGGQIEAKIVFDDEGLLIPNEHALERIAAVLSDKTDLILGIGSGVINDLCKYTGFRRELPYYIVATAPSMDGYASVGAALITDNMKTTFNARVPAAIIGDVDILKNAPMRMIQSGFGDIIGKYSALNDWKLAHLLSGEYLCRYVYDLVYDMVLKTEKLAAGILKRDPEAIRVLMETLVIVGIAMSYVGNSRPASGSEHHLSHYFEITGIMNHRDYFLHGIDVAYSTVKTQQMREKLLQYATFPAEKVKPFDRAVWEAEIRKNYLWAADGVMALQDKCGYYTEDYPARYEKNWDAVCDVLREVPSSENIKEVLATAGLDFAEFEAFYGKELIDDCSRYAKDLKDRYTVLWVYNCIE